MTSLSQPRNTRTLPQIRARGFGLANNNPNSPDNFDDQLNALAPDNARQDEAAPDNAAQAPAPQQSQPTPDTPPAQPSVKTPDDFLNEVYSRFKWFPDQQRPDQKRITYLNSCTHVETYKLTEDGFQLTVAGSNRPIRWILTPPGQDGTPAQQRIQGQSDGFDLSDANAMVALSAIHGWTKINVHGSQHERELLWYAAKSQGIEVVGYQPTPDTDIYKKWHAEHPDDDDNDTAPPVIKGSGTSPGPVLTPGSSDPQPAPTPQPPVNDNTPPDANNPPAAPDEDQDPDLSGLNKEQLTYLLERYTAEEKFAISQNDPNLAGITRIKEAATKALADLAAKDAAPADADKPADATPPADAAKKPAEKPAKKTKPAAKTTKPAKDAAPADAPAKDAAPKAPATKAPAAKDPAPKAPAAKDKFAGGKTTDAFNGAKDKKAPAAPKPAAPAQNNTVEYKGNHRAGTGHTNAKSVIAREQKKVAAPK